MSPELQSADNTLAIIRSAGHLVTAEDEADYRALFAELRRRLDSAEERHRQLMQEGRPAVAVVLTDMMRIMRATAS